MPRNPMSALTAFGLVIIAATMLARLTLDVIERPAGKPPTLLSTE